MIKRQYSIVCAVVLVISLFFARSHATEPIDNTNSILSKIGMVTGSPTGTYFRFGQDMRKLVQDKNIDIVVKESGGSIDNINRISSKENAALGIVQSDVLGFLTRSQQPQSKKIAENLRLVFPFYSEEVHVITQKSIESFDSLNGKNVVVGPEGSGSWLTSINMFNITGVKPAKLIRLAPEQGVMEVLLGNADAMIFVAGKPVTLFKNLEELSKNTEYENLLKKIHFLPINDERLLLEYSTSSIRPEDYNFVEDPIPTISVTAVLVSYDFSDIKNEYAMRRCTDLQKFSTALSNDLSVLQKSGHPKWREVNLQSEIGLWKRDACTVIDASTISLENELRSTINNQ